MGNGERSGNRLRLGGAARRRLAAAAAATVICLAAAAARAQSGMGDYVGRWSVSGELGYAVPNTDQYGDVLVWRAGVGYSGSPQIEIGLDVGRFETAVTQPEPDGVPTHDIASGNLEVLPVCVTLRYRSPLPESMATFVLLGGAGYYLVDYTMAEEQRELFVSGGGDGLPDQTVRDSWGFHAGAGLEYALSSWFSVTAEARYVILSPHVSGTAKDGHQLGGSLDLNTWLFTGGIRVAF